MTTMLDLAKAFPSLGPEFERIGVFHVNDTFIGLFKNKNILAEAEWDGIAGSFTAVDYFVLLDQT